MFQNDIIQLIQYAPTTAEVYERPLLIVPPWINKYYILDLVPEKSFVKAAIDQGFTVFMVSWVNPDARLSAKTFEDYMREGILAATDAVIKQTGQPWINALGYCVGGHCSPRRSPICRQPTTTGSPRRASSPRRSISARPEIFWSLSTTLS